MEESLTILYTYTIRGQLDLLPRLHTFIRQLRRDLPTTERSYLVDLGESCHPEVWPCTITEGRSTLFVMDAMGYDVANITGQLTSASFEKLRNQVMIHLVDVGMSYMDKGILFSSYDGEDLPIASQLRVLVTPAEANQWVDHTLYLLPAEVGQVGVVQLIGGGAQFSMYPMPSTTAIDATIAGAVDFVRDEARYYEKRNRSDDESSE